MTGPLLTLVRLCGSMAVPVLMAVAVFSVRPAVGTDQSKLAVDEFMTTYLELSSSQVSAIHRGNIVTTDLPAGDSREVVVAGAVRIGVTPAFFLERVRDVEDFRRGENVRAVGMLSRPPSLSDFDRFVLDRRDLDDLRKCRVGRCAVKFDAAALHRFASEVDWSASDARDHANHIVRETLFGYATRYSKWGRTALPVLHDREAPVSRAHEISALIGRTRVFADHFAELPAHLAAFPASADERAEHLLYWSQEAFGLKPVANLTHMTIWREPGVSSVAVIVSQQLYASHYFDGSLAVTVLFNDGADPSAVYVAYINRTLGDALEGGWFAPLKRSIARGRARDGLASTLRVLRTRLESLQGESLVTPATVRASPKSATASRYPSAATLRARGRVGAGPVLGRRLSPDVDAHYSALQMDCPDHEGASTVSTAAMFRPLKANHSVPAIPKPKAVSMFSAGLRCHRNAPPNAATETMTSRTR